jgi:hypothetical protein
LTKSQCRAPKSYDDEYSEESDVVFLKSMLYELIMCCPRFPKNLRPWATAKQVNVNDERPSIPAYVRPAVQGLIRKSGKRNPGRRTILTEIVDGLQAMTGKLTHNVDSSKLPEFVTTINE